MVPALLRKLAVCGECGSLLYTDKGGKRPWPSRYYICSSGGPCRVYHRMDTVDAAVWAKLEEWLQRPANLRSGAEWGGPAPESFAPEIADARRVLKKLDREELNVARLLARGQIQQRIGDRLLAENAARRADVEQRLRAATLHEDAATHRRQSAKVIEERIASLRAGIANATPEDRAELFRLVFPRGGVVLHPGGRIELRGALPFASDLPSSSPKPSGSRGAA
jgi:hypothetical protein